jgi:fructokinase
MLPANPLTPPSAQAVVVGTGRLTLDVIIHESASPAAGGGGGEPMAARSQAGGTCGNVLANLAYLGWQAYPLADLGDDDPGQRFTNDLARWGVHLDLIRHVSGEQTPVIIHYIREIQQGRSHSFSSRCPICGQRLRYHEPVYTEAVRERLPNVPDARVFFFDRDSQGAMLLARHCAGKGALIVFEPNYAGKETLFPQALQLAHVLKYSREKLPDLEAHYSLSPPGLIIETWGAEGLRYRDQRFGTGSWQHLPAVRVDAVRDAAGSGDWCTAGFIHRLGQEGLAGFRAASTDDLRDALRFGQALAALGCCFAGARGAAYACDRAAFTNAVTVLLQGGQPELPQGEPSFDLAGAFCPRCQGRSAS